jgi:hypothetical protein
MSYKIIRPIGDIAHYDNSGNLLKIDWDSSALNQTNLMGLPYSNSCYFDYCGGIHYHREDGPAIDQYDVTIYFKHGKKHRLDGPAYCNYQENLFYPNKINTIEEWWYEGRWIKDCENLEQFQKILKLKAFW